MRMFLDTPKKKNGVYVSKMRGDDKNSTIRIKINNAKFVGLNNIPGSGDLLRIWIPPTSVSVLEELKSIDENSLNIIIENNEKWFKNSLLPDQIKEFFRPSLNTLNNTMAILNTLTQQSLIVHDSNVVDSLSDIDFAATRINVEIEAQGFYFFQKKCGIRWIIRKLAAETETLNESTDDWVDRAAIEKEWGREIDEIDELINRECAALANKTARLQEFKQHIHSELGAARAAENMNIEWNAILQKLSLKISKYYDGILEM